MVYFEMVHCHVYCKVASYKYAVLMLQGFQYILNIAHFLFWSLRGADLFLSLDFEFFILSCCALESTTQWRLSYVKVELELELYKFLGSGQAGVPE